MDNKYLLYIGGNWVETNNTIEVLDKYIGKPFATVCTASAVKTASAVEAAATTFKTANISPFESIRYWLERQHCWLIM